MKEHRRKKRWHKLVTGLACMVVFCTTYTLILPAITLEADGTLSCLYTVHQHTEDCYDGEGNLTCGLADYVIHTHDADACFDGEGQLICELPQVQAHQHDESCYEEQRVLICEDESEDHKHDESCYEMRTVLVCEQPEIIPHTHSEDCYDQEGNLTCGFLQVEEHQHTDSCFVSLDEDVALMTLDEGAEETSYNKVESFYLWLHVRDVNEDIRDVYSAPKWEDGSFQGSGIKDALTYTENEENYYLIPIEYFIDKYGDYGYSFDASDTAFCPFTYAPDANDGANDTGVASYVQVEGKWYVQVQDTGDYAPPRSNIYYTTYNTEEVSDFRFWLHAKNKDESKYTSVAQYDSINSDSPNNDVKDVLQVKNLDGSTTQYYLIPIEYFIDKYGDYGYSFDASDTAFCPFTYAPDANYGANNTGVASYVQVEGKWYVMVQDTGNYDPPRSNIYYISSNSSASVVTDTVSPSGTVINLFDYWTTEKIENDLSEKRYTDGINKDHALKFKPTGLLEANAWTGTAAVYPGIVANTLGKDGYPCLSGAEIFGDENDELVSSDESLDYLFDPTMDVIVDDSSYKDSYRNVTGLLQVDEDGYYYYDSQQNYAEFDEGDNGFTLYDTWSLTYTSNNRNTIEGQFFPFDSYDSVGKDMNAGIDALNHYFGMTLTTRFVQQYDGYTNSVRKTPTTFEFSGDDDVWIFIDGVLVADLGGIHDPASVSIDFSTGEVVINKGKMGKDGESCEISTTLFKAFEEAGQVDKVEWSDTESDTFANNTYHTLKFYYLERGSYASNLSLKYNLTAYPPIGINKVDQYGAPISGAEFSVYQADVEDGSWTYHTDEKPLYTGVTDKNGKMAFVDEDNMPYTMDELEDMFGEYFILKETKAPAGYRLVSEEIKLHIKDKVLTCENTYESGVWAAANLQVTAPAKLWVKSGTDSGTETNPIDYYDVDAGKTEGTLFAVVLKYVGDRDDNGDATGLERIENWAALYGTDETGFHLVKADDYDDDFIKAAAYAVSQYKESQPVFSTAANGNLSASINGLPGDITTYYYMLPKGDKGKTQYTVAYYWTSKEYDPNDPSWWNEINKNNTSWIDADTPPYAFDRVFGATINVPNLTNRLYAQKLDEDGGLVNGATFALYQVEEETEADGTSTICYVDSDGNKISLEGAEYTIDPNTGQITGTTAGGADFTIEPADNVDGVPLVVTTAANGQGGNDSGEDGTAVFSVLKDGQYYLREIAAPDGYKLNTAEVMVRVTGDAIYANAGTEDDGVTVARGPGYLVSTLSQAASQGDIDNTLTWVYEKMRISGESKSFQDFDNSGEWDYLTANYSTETGGEDSALTTHLVYDTSDGANTLFNYTVNSGWYDEYDENEGDASAVTRRLYTSVGWSYYELYQDYDYGSKHVKNGGSYTKVEGEIANLFSRSVYVQVTDEYDSNLTIKKVDATGSLLPGAKFTLTRTVGAGKDAVTYCWVGTPVTSEDEDPDSEAAVDGGDDADPEMIWSWIEATDENQVKPTVLTSDKDGSVVKLDHLLAGTYTLTEVNAPAGYNKLTVPVTFIVRDGRPPTVSAADGGSYEIVQAQNEETGAYEFTASIYNTTGYELPNTGGVGIMWYTLSGLPLMGGGLLYLLTKRRGKGGACL